MVFTYVLSGITDYRSCQTSVKILPSPRFSWLPEGAVYCAGFKKSGAYFGRNHLAEMSHLVEYQICNRSEVSLRLIRDQSQCAAVPTAVLTSLIKGLRRHIHMFPSVSESASGIPWLARSYCVLQSSVHLIVQVS